MWSAATKTVSLKAARNEFAPVDARAVNRIRIFNRRRAEWCVVAASHRMLERDGLLGPSDQLRSGLLPQELVNERDGNRALANGGCYAFHVPAAHITGREDPGQTGFQQIWPPR